MAARVGPLASELMQRLRLGSQRHHQTRSFRRYAWALLGCFATLFLLAPSASAHAELWQSSPDAGEVVGEELHSITLFFFGLNADTPQVAKVFDAAGNELAGQVNRDDQRLVIALIDPIATPGDYLVTYDVVGIDGDFSSDSFSFTWEEGAPAPAGISVAFAPNDDSFDVVNFGLLLAAAGIAAFLVHRVMAAIKEHRATQTATRVD